MPSRLGRRDAHEQTGPSCCRCRAVARSTAMCRRLASKADRRRRNPMDFEYSTLVFKRTLVPYRHYLLASLRAGLSAIAMVVIATIITACSKSEAEAPSPPPPEVDAAQVVTKYVRQWDEFTGRIAAIGAVDIRPRVSGYIDRIALKEGDMVNAGDLLFVVDPRPYRAAYGSAVAQLERARASAQLAEVQYKRAEALIKTAAVSVDAYDTRSAA